MNTILPTHAVTDVTPLQPAGGLRPAGEAPPSEAVDFEQVLRSTVDRVNAASHTATQKVEALAAGASDDIHGTMIAVREADIGVKLVGSIRNKLLDAFHELWRTGV